MREISETMEAAFRSPQWPRRATWEKAALLVAGVAVIGIVGANPLLTMLALGALVAIGPLLWRAGEVPVLAYLVAFQWLEAGVPLLVANFTGEELGAADSLVEREIAAALSFVGVLVLAIGMRIGRGRPKEALGPALDTATQQLSPTSLSLWYGAGLMLALAADTFIWLIPGTRQLLLPLVDIRWIVVVLIVWVAIWIVPLRRVAVVIFLAEILIGFSGYFSGFKEVVVVGILTMLWAASFVMLRRLKYWLIGMMAVGLALLTFWQAIKVDYRQFLNQGTSSQVVLVSPGERAAFILERAAQVTMQDLAEGLDSGLERVGYIEYFALSIRQVPSMFPHEKGRLWWEAIDHVLRPRLFFPEKASIDDSERVREYTGEMVAGAEQGTSINIGYFGESYIDFGPVGMFVPLLLVGVLYGWVYRVLLRAAPNPLLGSAVALTALLGSYGGSNIKLLGGTLTTLIVYWGLLALGGNWLWGRLSSGKLRSTAMRSSALHKSGR